MELGQVVVTRGVADKMEDAEFAYHVYACLERHASGDWGDVCPEDWQTNNLAVETGERTLSSYVILGTKIWIITELDRSTTTVLFPHEY